MTYEVGGQASNTALQPDAHNVLSTMPPGLSSRNLCLLCPPGTSAQSMTYSLLALDTYPALLTHLSLYMPSLQHICANTLFLCGHNYILSFSL